MDAVAVFVKVVEVGSFSVAARQLGMPKTTVSAKVAGLEKRLGIRLIQRTTRKLRPTEAGERYFRHCANAVRELELGEAALQSAKEKPSGVLRVTASADIGHTVLPRIARAYATKYPDVLLELIVTNQIVDIVDEGVDLAIRWARALKDSSLIVRRFFETRTSLWTSSKYLESLGKLTHPRDLAKAVFVTPSVQNKSMILTNGKSDFEIQRGGRICADDAEVIKALLVLGEGIAWLPDFLTAGEAATGELVQVLPQWRPRQQQLGTCYFVYATRQYALPKVESFIQTALGQV